MKKRCLSLFPFHYPNEIPKRDSEDLIHDDPKEFHSRNLMNNPRKENSHEDTLSILNNNVAFFHKYLKLSNFNYTGF